MELKTIGLTKKFSSKTAVDNLNITLTNGVYGLLGANGAGKTTLMRLLCNIQNPTSGRILLNEKNIVGLGERYRNLLGYLPQHFGYYPDFSAYDFLRYVSALKGLDEKAAHKKSKELLEAVDLSRESKHKIKTFSGGILFSALLSFSTFQNKYAFDQNIGEGTGKTAVEIDKEIAAKYKGILTDEKVQQLMSDFAPTSDLHGLSAIYVYQNAMQSAAFSRFSDEEGKWNGLSVSDVFGNEEIKIGYVDGWLSTSRNMVRVFVALALAVIIMLAPIFSGEYEGVDNIILTSKYGKTKCATAKVVAGIITAVFTTTLVAAFNLLFAFVFYGTEGLDCSILFAPSDYVEAFIPFNITCWTLLKYQILLAFTCTLSVTGITLFLSAICHPASGSAGSALGSLKITPDNSPVICAYSPGVPRSSAI